MSALAHLSSHVSGFIGHIFLTFFFFNDTATTEIYTLSLHDALPIWNAPAVVLHRHPAATVGHADHDAPGAGVARVLEQVHEHFLDLVLAGEDRRAGVAHHLHPGARFLPAERVQLHHLPPRGLEAHGLGGRG